MRSEKMYVGMDVHKDTVTVAVLPEGAAAPTMKTLPNEPRRLERFFERVSRDGEVRACYEASGVGYVLQRAMTLWGHRCDVEAPPLTSQRPGERRKHDTRDAIGLAAVPGGRAGGDPCAVRGAGTGARSGALPGDVPARDPQVAPLSQDAARTPGVRLPALQLDPGPLRLDPPSAVERGAGGRGRGGGRRVPGAARVQAPAAGTNWIDGSRRWRSSRPTVRRWGRCAASAGSIPMRPWYWQPRSATGAASPVRPN
ncbi:MAG: hypothetical protein ACREX3_21275 [Gammaproteobacteria bacterium]